MYRYAVPLLEALINQPRAFHSSLQGNFFLYVLLFGALLDMLSCFQGNLPLLRHAPEAVTTN